MKTSLRRERSAALSGDAPEVGTLLRVSEDGKPFVEYCGSHGERIARCAIGAVTPIPRSDELAGAAVLLVFERGDRNLPIIIGFVQESLWGLSRYEAPAAKVAPGASPVKMEGTTVVIEGEQAIELRCGQGSIRLAADGHVVIKGERVTSRARETNKVRGAVVLIN
jgi:hypothetical protein